MERVTSTQSLLWRDGQLAERNFPLDELDVHLHEPNTLVWYDLCEADVADLEELAAELGFDPHAVEDATAPEERAKAQNYDTHTFINVYAVRLLAEAAEDLHDSRLQTSRISIFMLPNALITVRRNDRFDFAPVLQTWKQDHKLIESVGVGGLLHGLLDVVVDGHFATIQQLDEACELLEDRLFDNDVKNNAVQAEIYRMRKELVELRRVVLPMREIVATVQRHEVEQASDARHLLDPWWQDLMDHVLRASEWTESLRDMVTSLFETNLSLQDARLNTVMKRLAGWGAVFAIPTAVTGWFGQNVPYPGFSTPFGFVMTCVFTFGGALAMYLILRHYDWI